MRALPFGFLGPRGPVAAAAAAAVGLYPDARRALPSSALLPWEGAPPCTPAYYFTMRGATPLCTPRGEGAPPLQPRVTFPSQGKSPKARQGLRPLESPEVSAKLWEPDAVRFEGWNVSPIELKAITIPYRPFRARLRIAPGYLLPQNKTDLPL